MPPDMVKFPPKIDVYAFGVVLYELVSGKEAIIKTNEIVTESKGLVALLVSQTQRKIFLNMLTLDLVTTTLLTLYLRCVNLQELAHMKTLN